jgi:hypothetical protein
MSSIEDDSKYISCSHIPESLLKKWGVSQCSHCLNGDNSSDEGEEIQPCCKRVKLRVNATSRRPTRSRQKRQAEKRVMSEVKL